MARRGAREVTRQAEDVGFSDERERRRGAPRPSRPTPWVRADGARDEWEDSAPLRSGTRKAAEGGASASAGEAIAALSTRHTLPPEIATDIRNAADVATALQKERLVEGAESAYGAYERGRYQDALRAIKPVADVAPGVAAVRELAGLAAYRSSRWREASRHLQAFGTLSDSAEHLPVLMDCQRALHKPKKVAELWSELRQSSPDPDVLAEGRIVAAASLADTGDLNGAISMLASAGASKALRNPSDRHIRQWYLLADLYGVLRTGAAGRRPGLRRGGPPARPRPRAARPGQEQEAESRPAPARGPHPRLVPAPGGFRGPESIGGG
ncbi:MAG: hypothetical protein ABSB68_02890 [Acidimicrobiales bacterium]